MKLRSVLFRSKYKFTTINEIEEFLSDIELDFEIIENDSNTYEERQFNNCVLRIIKNKSKLTLESTIQIKKKSEYMRLLNYDTKIGCNSNEKYCLEITLFYRLIRFRLKK